MSFGDSYHVEKLMLKTIGLSIEKNTSLAYKLYAFTIIFFAFIAYFLLQLIDLLNKDLDSFLDSYMIFIGSGILMVGTPNFYYYRLRIAKMLTKSFNPSGDAEFVLIRKWQRGKKIKLIIFCIASAGTLGVQILHSFVLRLNKPNPQDWKLHYGTIFLIDVTRSPNFEIFLLYQSLSITYQCTTGIAFTILVTGILDYVSMQLKILQARLKTIVHVNEIKPAVNFHVTTLQNLQELEVTFGIILLLWLGSVTVVTCFNIYRITKFQDSEMGRIFLEWFAVTCASFLMSKAGDNVIRESEKVAEAAYEVDFVSADLRLQKSIMIIIRQAQKPVALRVLKLLNVSLATFATFLRMSYSLFMMLKNVKNE